MTPEEHVATSYIKVSSCAQVIEKDAATVYRLRDRGVLRGLTIDGAQFISISSLEKYLAGRTLITTRNTNRENGK